MRGKVYKYAKREADKQVARSTTDAGVAAGITDYLKYLDKIWDGFVAAAWHYLWDRRDKNLFRIRLLGIKLYTYKWIYLKDEWEEAFGPCPFPWDLGPSD